MTISWRNPSKHPTKIFIDGLYMLIVPKNGMMKKIFKVKMTENKK